MQLLLDTGRIGSGSNLLDLTEQISVVYLAVGDLGSRPGWRPARSGAGHPHTNITNGGVSRVFCPSLSHHIIVVQLTLWVWGVLPL